MSEETRKILALFSANEHKIESLYKSYSDKFPDHKNLWNRLAIKKRYQAEVLKDLSLRSESHELVKTESYVLQILNYVSAFLDQQFKKLKLGKIFLKEALIVTLRLEQTSREKSLLELLEPKQIEVSKFFNLFTHQASQNINILTKIYNRSLSQK